MAGQVALAVVLTVSAVLLLRTVATLYSQDVGFEPDGLLIISVAKPRWELNALRSQIAAKARQNKEGVPTSEDIEPVRRWHESFDKRLEEVLSAIPGVQSVATAQQTPIARATEMLNEVGCAEGASSSPKVVRGLMETVSPAYFRTMGIPLLSGRGFGPGDHAGTQRIALVNRTLARQCWPDGQVIGKTIKTPWDEPTVIGVVGDVRDLGADREPVPKLYWSRTQYRQQPAHTVMLRTERDAAAILPEVRKAIREAHPETPTYHVRLGEDLVRDSNWKRRYLTILLGSLGSLALILASLGVYGLVGQAVRERTREIGLRMAVGAAPSEVLWMVLRKGFSIATIGIVVGSVAAMGLTRFLESLLYGVQPLDGLTFGLVAVVMMAAALLASYLPARRAAKLDPTAALRCD